jgi:hypothetical protein
LHCLSIRQTDTPTLAATKGPANSNQKNPLTEEKNLAREQDSRIPSHRCVSCTGDADRRVRLAGSVRLTRSWCHLRNNHQDYTQVSRLPNCCAGWRANLIGPVRISNPPRASSYCMQSTHTQPGRLSDTISDLPDQRIMHLMP